MSIEWTATSDLAANLFSLKLYGQPNAEIDGLIESVRENGILVPLVVCPIPTGFEIVSGHRRHACATALGLTRVPCEIREATSEIERNRLVVEYNRQRRKTFSQMMREADALESWRAPMARERRLANLDPTNLADRRNSDDRSGRTDQSVARAIGLGGKDIYRQARAVWAAAEAGDVRARAGVVALDAGEKTIFAAYKDLRRRGRFTTGFRPTPYDVWAFKHDRAYGVPHPGSIPASIVAHALHYFTLPDALVVDPMAGGGTTLDVCLAMGRRCLAYDIAPVRDDIRPNDLRRGLPAEADGCDLIFGDPPYHTMLAGRYADASVSNAPLSEWRTFLGSFADAAYAALRPGGYVALLLANQTEKDLPAGFGYLDNAFFGYEALRSRGFLPERRISCPMDGAYLPQHVKRARADGRMLGQVRDLLVMRKPLRDDSAEARPVPGQSIGSPPTIS